MKFLQRHSPVLLPLISPLILHFTHAFHILPLPLVPTFPKRRSNHSTIGTSVASRQSSPVHTIMRPSRVPNDEPGDKLRESTGKRPSVHPTVINAVSEALLLRSSSSPPDSVGPMEVSKDATALDVAVAAGDLATRFITKRASSSTAVKGDEESGTFTQDESTLVAGRVVGVVMRFELLEETLRERVKTAKWVSKYGEEGSFGLMKEELEEEDGVVKDKRAVLDVRLKDDPLLRMCRAECLYALFLSTVEAPTMEKMGEDTPGGSMIDFLDSDKMEVLIQ